MALAALWPITIYVAIPCCVEITGGTANEEQERAERAHYKSGCSEADPWPIFIDKDFVPPKDAESREGPTQEECADLKAQWAMAVSARRLVDLTCYQLWLAAIGSILLGGTLAYTAVSAQGAVNAARAAERAIDVQQRIQQPLLVPTNIEYDVPDVSVLFDLANFGKTPAILDRSVSSFSVSGRPPLVPAYLAEPFEYDAHILVSEGTARQTFVSHRLTDGIARSEDDPDGTIYLWGCIFYDDIFGRSKQLGFGFRGTYSRLIGRYTWRRFGGKPYNYDDEIDT